MLLVHRFSILSIVALLIFNVIAQEECEDYVADENDCTKFIRCFDNVRIRFTCPPGTAWEDSVQTCIFIQLVEACQEVEQQPRKLVTTDDKIIYDADVNALNETIIAGTLAKARALGPIVTPKQYQCSFCSTGTCGIVVNTIQCVCGSFQCQSSTTTTTTVQPRNPCATNPCLNGGQCIPSGPGFTCNCPETYTGNRCEAPAPTPCQPNPCQNGGTCCPQGSSYTCQCPSQYYGYCCENRLTTTTPYNPCVPYPCQNGAACVPDGNVYLCQCPTGFYGARCESRNYCMPNPCSNNGYCTQTTTGYLCSCLYPYTGTNCQQIITTTTTTTTTVATRAPCGGNCACIFFPCPTIIVTNPCSPNPCQNMGGCAVQNKAAKCWCPDNYQGYYCQYRRSARLLTSQICNKTCLNGGECYIDDLNGGQPKCSCPDDYFGSQCEYINRPKSCTPKNPCMNNGKCITTSIGSQCVCQKGTSGVLCERIERSLTTEPCPLNCQANGTCVYVDSIAECRCPPGRTGYLCEFQSANYYQS